MGTSGTFMGVSRRLHRDLPHVKCYSGQPSSGFHGLEGLKHMPTPSCPASTIPPLADGNIWLETEEPTHGAAPGARRRAAGGHFVRMQRGHAACKSRANWPKGETGMIVTVLCDSAEKYLSEHFWEEE
jgi:cysteine synthase B